MIPNTLAGLFRVFPLLASAAARPKNAILLSEVKTLTLRGHGFQTSHRRVPSIPQLKCVSSKAICNLFDIDVMRCTNEGSSYGSEDIEWSCTASLPEELKLGGTDVICEGYSSPEDPYVLKGSCGVEYRLSLTKKGQHRYPDLAGGGGWFSDDEGGTDWGASAFTVIFVAVLLWILYSACIATQDPNRPRRRGNNYGGGGGGGGGWGPGWGPDGNDPPPPYPGSKPSSSEQQGWRPGFWSGLAGGATAGYLAGNRNRNAPRRGYGSNWGADSGSGARPSTGRSSSSSSQRHESTGFGSTSRR